MLKWQHFDSHLYVDVSQPVVFHRGRNIWSWRSATDSSCRTGREGIRCCQQGRHLLFPLRRTSTAWAQRGKVAAQKRMEKGRLRDLDLRFHRDSPLLSQRLWVGLLSRWGELISLIFTGTVIIENKNDFSKHSLTVWPTLTQRTQ